MPAGEHRKNPLTPYEKAQVDQIAAWKSEPPNPIAELWNLIALQAAKIVTKPVPQTVIRGAIELSYKAAKRLSWRESLARRAGVTDISELREKPLEECDRLAREVSLAARTLAATEGAVTGAAGPIMTAIDVPLLFASALRTIVRIGYCYGYSADAPKDRYFNLGVLTIATAGSLATRLERLDQLDDLEKILVEETQVDVIRSELLSFLFQLEIFEEIPGIGVVSGAVLNLSFMHRVDVTARKVFQERWLKDNGKLAEIAPAEEVPWNLVAGWSGLAGRAVYATVHKIAFGVTLPAFAAASLWRRNGGDRTASSKNRQLTLSTTSG